MSSLLDSVGADLLAKSFISLTRKACDKTIAAAYCDIVAHENASLSEDSAVQLLSDVLFLETVLLAGENSELVDVRKRLLERVFACALEFLIIVWRDRFEEIEGLGQSPLEKD